MDEHANLQLGSVQFRQKWLRVSIIVSRLLRFLGAYANIFCLFYARNYSLIIFGFILLHVKTLEVIVLW